MRQPTTFAIFGDSLPAHRRLAVADRDRYTPDPPAMIPQSPCNLCGTREVEEVAGLDRHGKPLQTVICRKCGLVWTDPIPSQEALRRFYSEQYRLQYKRISQPTLEHVYRAGKVAAQRFRHLKGLLKPGSVIVDVGSGGGEFVYLMRCLDFDAQGVQPLEGYARYSQEELGIEVHLGFAREIQIPPRSCHMVTLYHSLEHMASPTEVLEHVRGWLEPRGWLVIEVPNVEATCQSPGHRYHQAHIYSFNDATLRRLGEKAGFRPHRTDLSPDGGNISAVFGKESPGPIRTGIPGNCERIMGTIQRHTLLRHFSSFHPYTRPLRRLGRRLKEKRAARRFHSGREVLDAIRSQELPTIPL
ncbi:MAG: class I SAM-dependent methyltransferase [Bryobacterales bacterium]|nr:class I SAM-dependent methyltransferase [Bryobacterales bacterium]